MITFLVLSIQMFTFSQTARGSHGGLRRVPQKNNEWHSEPTGKLIILAWERSTFETRHWDVFSDYGWRLRQQPKREHKPEETHHSKRKPVTSPLPQPDHARWYKT